jgi:hypothetical protein
MSPGPQATAAVAGPGDIFVRLFLAPIQPVLHDIYIDCPWTHVENGLFIARARR